MFPHSVDVLVVGAGLAGLEASRRLATHGYKVLLIDQKQSLGAQVHTTGIFTRAALADWDVPDGMFGPAIRRVALFSPSMRRVALESAADEFRIGRMPQLYSHLLARAEEAGVIFSGATRFQCVETNETGSLVRLGGRLCLDIQTRFILGADGARSRVANMLGLSTNTRFLVGAEIVGGAPDSAPRLECYLDARLAPGYIGWLASDGETAHVGVAGNPDCFNAQNALQAFCRKIGFETAIGERRGGLIPIGGVLPRTANRHGLLIGDAAGAVSPLTAGGFEGALRSARHATSVVAEFLESGEETVLRAYSAGIRAPQAKAALRYAFDLFHSNALLETGFFLLRLSPFRAIARRVFFGRSAFSILTTLPRAPLVLPSATARR